MPIGIAAVDGVVERICIAVEVDALLGGVVGVGGEEAATEWIVISGVQILQPRLGVVALVDIALGLGLADGGEGGPVAAQRCAIGAVVKLANGEWRIANGKTIGGQVVGHQEVCCGAFAFYIGVEIGGEQSGGIGRVDQKLGLTAHVEIGIGPVNLARPLAIGAVGEAGLIAVLGDGGGPILAVIGEGARLQRPGAVHVIGQGVAVGVVGDGGSADRGGDVYWPAWAVN